PPDTQDGGAVPPDRVSGGELWGLHDGPMWAGGTVTTRWGVAVRLRMAGGRSTEKHRTARSTGTSTRTRRTQTFEHSKKESRLGLRDTPWIGDDRQPGRRPILSVPD